MDDTGGARQRAAGPFLCMAARFLLPCIVAAVSSLAAAMSPAQEQKPAEEPKPPSPWSNSTELSFVWTAGNSDIQTFGLKDTFEYKTGKGRARFRIDVLRTYSSDDPYLLVEPGLTFPPGGNLQNFDTRAVYPDPDLDVGRYFAEGRYEGNLPRKMTWSSGASWDRDEDAGIISRTIVFAGLGRVWRDREDFVFRTSYQGSYTDRIEEIDDPERDKRFPGLRFTSDLMDHWGKSTTYDNDFIFNINVTDLGDYWAELTQGVAVSMSKILSLKVSLQLNYASEPALEDVDLIIRAQLVDPDGVPGSGDEFFETVSSGGFEIKVGEDNLRKERLDFTFRTSLLITW